MTIDRHPGGLGPREEPAEGFHPQALRSGARAPDFALENGRSQIFSLEHLRKKGPVALYFYRGAW